MEGTALFKQIFMVGAVLFCIGMTGCRDKMDGIYKGGEEEPEKVPNDFDYSTSKSVKVNFKYDVPTGFRAYFEMYTACPVSLDEDLSYVKSQTLLPIAGGYTDENGSFSLTLDIASFVEDIYLYSTQAGVSTLLHSKIVGNTVGTFEKYTPERITAKAVARAGIEGDKKTKGSGFKNWPAWKYGTSIKPIEGGVAPVAKISITEKIQSEINNSIKTTVGTATTLDQARFRDDITFRGDAEIKLYYFNHGASERRNSLTYYTRSQNESVNDDPVYYLKDKAIMAFDQLSIDDIDKGVQLKYKADGEEWTNSFPKGTALSFALLADGGTSNYRNVAFSYWNYNRYEILNNDGSYSNRHNKPHMGVFKLSNSTEDKAYVVLCFEDYPWSENPNVKVPERTQTFDDDVFIMEVSPASALPDDIPDPTPEGDKNKYDYFIMNSGIWAFEDNWPKNGDYDMNDIVVSYIRTMYCTYAGEVVSLTDKMQFLNNGATYSNAFGYVLGGGVQRSNIKSIDIKSSPKSSYSQNPGLDEDLDDATIMLFDNGKNVDKNAIFETHVEFETYPDFFYFAKSMKPVNPFIVVNGSAETPRTEVHLPKYAPTKKNNNELFGTENDCSKGVSDSYYISNKENNYPFAIELIGVEYKKDENEVTIPDFTTSPEGVAIDESYPSFVDWVTSGGKTNSDWYLHPKK